MSLAGTISASPSVTQPAANKAHAASNTDDGIRQECMAGVSRECPRLTTAQEAS